MSQNNNKVDEQPVIPASQSLPEITWRAVGLGVILTIVLAAANAYLGLKVGVTVSASIPAAVISMGILRFFKDSNILENTMVQIMASVGEALTAGVAFILPALIILHAWSGFNYWQTVITALLGGFIGVLFTIPLRRALLKDKTLRYPEAVAIANVLKTGASNNEGDLRPLVAGGIVGALIAFCQTGLRVLSDSFQLWLKGPSFLYGFGLGLSPALIAAGYIVGVNVAISVLFGVVLCWLLGVPALSFYYGVPSGVTANHAAMIIWSQHIRYIGVGTMLVGGIWTLCTLFKPVLTSMSASWQAMKGVGAAAGHVQERTERDIPIHFVFVAAAVLLAPLYLLIHCWMIPSGYDVSTGMHVFLSAFTTLYIFIGGFAFCSIMAYFAGLIGSSNSPVSGLLVSALLILSLIFMGIFGLTDSMGGEHVENMVGIVVAIGGMVVIGAALAISNDTMQDLKVGQIVGATPWKQQFMLFLGVIVASFVVPPILELLYNAYGIGGVFPRPNMDPTQMLAAPQAGLMATVAKGAFTHKLNWPMINLGALIAVICIVIDEYVRKNHGTRLPVLAVGLGIYLPLESSVPVIIGGFLAYIVERKLSKLYPHGNRDNEKQLATQKHKGLLLSCGLVAGASLIGVVLAIPFAIQQSSDALDIMPASLTPFAGILGVAVTIALCLWMYRTVVRK